MYIHTERRILAEETKQSVAIEGAAAAHIMLDALAVALEFDTPLAVHDEILIAVRRLDACVRQRRATLREFQFEAGIPESAPF